MSSRFGRGPGRVRIQLTAGAAALAMLTLAAGCSGDDDDGARPGGDGTSAPRADGPAAAVRAPEGCTTVLDAETPAQLSVAVSQALFTSAPVVVVAPAEDYARLQTAAQQAEAAGAPLLVTGSNPTRTPSATSTASPSAVPTAGPVDFEAESADCAAPPPEVLPSATPSTTPSASASASASASPSASASSSADAEPEETEDPGTEPTATASPSITPAAFGVAMADGSDCLDSAAVEDSPAEDEATAEPTATSPSPSATPTATPTATATATATASSSASPTLIASTTPTPTTGPDAADSVLDSDVPLDPSVATEIRRLDPEAVLATDPAVAADIRAALPEVKVVENPADLPESGTPAPLSGLAVLLPAEPDMRLGALAATTTATVAGADVVGVENGDPRAGECAVQALFEAKPTRVLGVGDFGSAQRLADRMAVVGTGVELPGGGQVFFPGRRLVALYGYPGAPELGVLGAQSVTASISRVRQVASGYDSISDVPVVPTFEVITTVAQSVPGRDGDYSAESSIDAIRPYVEQAEAAGVYVILDLQPGRTDFLTQAKRYEELLKLPHVGLALDPEWRLKPGQVHLRQIGSVDSSEINRVSAWLADLTAEYRLPQKLLVLHQFSLTMITNRAGLDTSHDEIALLIHMDGQGEPIQKEGTWRIVTNTIPETIWLGWKNFYKKDTRLMSPRETLDRERQPVMISYQ